MADKLCIVVCRNHAPEVRAALKAEGIEDALVAVFSGSCIRPGSAWDKAVEAGVSCGAEADGIAFLGGSCLTGTNELPAQWQGAYVIKADRCFDMIAGTEAVERQLREGAYLMSPGWLARWKRYMAEWGFDQETAKGFFGESVRKFVLLDTGVHPGSGERIREFAAFAGLPYEIAPVGLDYLRLFLSRVVLRWRLARQRTEQETGRQTGQQARRENEQEIDRQNERQARTAQSAELHKKVADYAMALDVIGTIAMIMDEEKVITDFLELFTMLFAPAGLLYLPVTGDQCGEVISRTQAPSPVSSPPCGGEELSGSSLAPHPAGRERGEGPGLLSARDRLISLAGDHAWTDSGNGFRLRIADKGETFGILEAEGFAFPQYKEHYLNLALSIAKVVALALANARTYGRLHAVMDDLERSNKELDRRLHEIKTLRGLLPVCSYCRKIRDDAGSWTQMELYIRDHSEAEFSHGICPACNEKALRELDELKRGRRTKL